jgi:uncharacterized membrane protein
MKSTARFFDHPIHPMLIPYPFAFLSGAAAFNVVAAARGDERLAQTARHLRAVGIAGALTAALPGVIDYFGTVPAGRPRETATYHALSNVSALGLFAASAMTQRDDGRPGAATLALELAGTVLLSIGGWLGGSLSYHHQVGVDPEESRAGALTPLPQRRVLP